MGIINILFITLIGYIFSKDFTNVQVRRTINLRNKIVTVNNEVLFRSDKNEPTYSYKYILPKNSTNNLIHMSVSLTSENEKEKVPDVKVTVESTDKDFIYYNIDFKKEPMNKGERRYLTVKEDYFEKLRFFPKNIRVSDSQYAVYKDSLNYLSAYSTEKQAVSVILPEEGTSIVRYTMRGSNKVKDVISYNLSSTIDAFTSEPFYIHYEYNEPFIVMNNAHKTFKVSHWGNIAVDEGFKLENVGAKLEGEFGRVDYDDYGRYGGKNALKYLRARLPIRSWGLWYRDEIGNVSTSNAAREWDDVKLTLYPRFPILGGWKSNFDIGYNLPSKFHVRSDQPGAYMVNLTFGMPFSDLLAKDYSLKVVLPEGAEVTNISLPIDSEYEVSYEKTFGCLDLFGRESVVFKMKNVYDIHKIPFQIYYKYSKLNLISKPLILIAYFFAIFLALIIYFRANFSLSKSPDKVKKE